MLIVADTHVHLYPCYDVARTLALAANNLSAICPNAKVKMLCLTERFDCDYWPQLAAKKFGLSVDETDEKHSLKLRVGGDQVVYIVAGRQIVTKERLEVLALGTTSKFEDGHGIAETIARVRGEDAVAVLPWSPGKWFFGRGKVIRRVIEMSPPGDIMISDPSSRPCEWPEPTLMTTARSRGLKLIAGSDPLPFAGDEKTAGTYGVSWEDDAFNERTPFQSFLRAHNFKIVGTRPGALTTFRRLRRLKKETSASKNRAKG